MIIAKEEELQTLKQEQGQWELRRREYIACYDRHMATAQHEIDHWISKHRNAARENADLTI